MTVCGELEKTVEKKNMHRKKKSPFLSEIWALKKKIVIQLFRIVLISSIDLI